MTSTTGRGRGRGRGPAKPRKTKKQKLAEQQQQQQQQLLEQQHMLMHQQQQYRQMGYQSKGMPLEMNPMMSTMGALPNMTLMNNIGPNIVTNNPNMTINTMQSSPNIPPGQNLASSMMSPNNNISPGITPNQGMTTGPPPMPINSNLVSNTSMPVNPNLNSSLNISSNNSNISGNANLIHNPNMNTGLNATSSSNLIPTPSVPSNSLGISTTAMPSNINMPPNVNIPNPSMQCMTEINPHTGLHPQHVLGQNMPPTQSSNTVKNIISNGNQNMQATLAPHIGIHQQQSQQCDQPQLQNHSSQAPSSPSMGLPNQQQVMLEVQNQQPTTPPPPTPPLPPPPPPMPPILSDQSASLVTTLVSNADTLSPEKESEKIPSPEIVEGEKNLSDGSNVLELVPTTEVLPSSSPPSSSVAETSVVSNYNNNSNSDNSNNNNNDNLELEVNTTCDVDSTNPGYEPISNNPYDFQSSFSSNELKVNSRSTEESEVDPYLMTDEALGGEIVPRKIRKQRKPRESKVLKEPKTTKEPKSRKSRSNKSAKCDMEDKEDDKNKLPKKKRESKSPKTPHKRGPKKRKASDAGIEDWEALESEDKRFFSLEDMAATNNTVSEPVNELNETKQLSNSVVESGIEETKVSTEAEVVTDSASVIDNLPETTSEITETTPKKRGRRKDNVKPLFSRSKSGSFGGSKRGRGGPGRKKKTLMDESDEDGSANVLPSSPGDDSENPNVSFF